MKKEKVAENRPIHRADSPETRETQLISLAVDLAEEQLRNHTASAQVITHYLKLGTARERLEQKKLEQEIELAKAKRGAIESSQHMEELMQQALDAFRSYSPDYSEEVEE